MTNEPTTETQPKSLEQVLETVPELQDQATLDGLSDLITKAAPLIQGRRLHNIVDLLAATSDVIEMADDAMVQKLMALYEEGIGGAWAITNALRYASAQAAQDETPPTLWQSLRRLSKDEDARHGLSVAINLAASSEDSPELPTARCQKINRSPRMAVDIIIASGGFMEPVRRVTDQNVAPQIRPSSSRASSSRLS